VRIRWGFALPFGKFALANFRYAPNVKEGIALIFVKGDQQRIRRCEGGHI
jgi:hypothetical protein